MITMYLQNNRFIRKCSYIFTHPTDKYCLEQHWIIEQHLQKMKIPIDTNDIIWPIHLFFCDILLLSIIKYKSGNRPYLLSVFCVNWQLQFQEVLFFIILDFFFYQTSSGLAALKHWCRKSRINLHSGCGRTASCDISLAFCFLRSCCASCP